jgi:hypothetical protein
MGEVVQLPRPQTVGQRWTEIAIRWLAGIGLEIELVDGTHPNAFMEGGGVWLDRGRVIVNPDITHVGDLLHEAGHLACIPSRFRELVEPGELPTPKLAEAIELYTSTNLFILDDIGTEDPTWRSIMQMGDCEATAWSYAAAKAIGLHAVALFEARHGREPYQGGGHDIWTMLDANSYFGINGLQAAGFCTVKMFPAMKRWLAP